VKYIVISEVEHFILVKHTKFIGLHFTSVVLDQFICKSKSFPVNMFEIFPTKQLNNSCLLVTGKSPKRVISLTSQGSCQHPNFLPDITCV
jgi:hypothetical protein